MEVHSVAAMHSDENTPNTHKEIETTDMENKTEAGHSEQVEQAKDPTEATED